MATTSRYTDVIHCTTLEVTENWRMSVGKVTFMDVSTITPQNDMSPVATTAAMVCGSMRSGSVLLC